MKTTLAACLITAAQAANKFEWNTANFTNRAFDVYFDYVPFVKEQSFDFTEQFKQFFDRCLPADLQLEDFYEHGIPFDEAQEKFLEKVSDRFPQGIPSQLTCSKLDFKEFTPDDFPEQYGFFDFEAQPFNEFFTTPFEDFTPSPSAEPFDFRDRADWLSPEQEDAYEEFYEFFDINPFDEDFEEEEFFDDEDFDAPSAPVCAVAELRDEKFQGVFADLEFQFEFVDFQHEQFIEFQVFAEFFDLPQGSFQMVFKNLDNIDQQCSRMGTDFMDFGEPFEADKFKPETSFQWQGLIPFEEVEEEFDVLSFEKDFKDHFHPGIALEQSISNQFSSFFSGYAIPRPKSIPDPTIFDPRNPLPNPSPKPAPGPRPVIPEDHFGFQAGKNIKDCSFLEFKPCSETYFFK